MRTDDKRPARHAISNSPKRNNNVFPHRLLPRSRQIAYVLEYHDGRRIRLKDPDDFVKQLAPLFGHPKLTARFAERLTRETTRKDRVRAALVDYPARQRQLRRPSVARRRTDSTQHESLRPQRTGQRTRTESPHSRPSHRRPRS